jgi:hypothetical protein
VSRSVGARDVLVRLSFELTRIPTGNGVEIATMLRSRSDMSGYQVRARVAKGGLVWLTAVRASGRSARMLGRPVRVPALRVRPGQSIVLETRVSGTRRVIVQARAWREGGRRATAWLLTRRDRGAGVIASGSVGFQVRAGSQASRLPVVAIDDFLARQLPTASRPRVSAVAKRRGPTITSIEASNVTRTTADITWSLDQAATGQVEYGTTRSYGSRSAKETSFDYSTHVQRLSDLRPGTTYHYRVRSEDRSGRKTVSSDRTFTTQSTPADPITPTPTPTPRPADPVTPTATPTPRPADPVTPAPTPSPRPTASPTPRPTATPTPRPTATPTPRPTATPAPADTTGQLVPSSIDRTGGSDVAAALNSFIRSVPNGSTIRFRPGTYRIDTAIVLDGRRNLVFDGDGATLQGDGCSPGDSMFLLGRSSANSGITIRDFTLRGNNPNGGTSSAFRSGCEHQMGVAIYGSSDVVITDVAISRVYGECVYVAEGSGGWSSDITFRDSSCSSTGRSGLAVVAGTRVTVANVAFDKIGMYVLNIEPNSASGGGTYVTFRDNNIGTYAHAAQFGDNMVCTNGGADGAPIHHITITRNRVTGGTMRTFMWEPRNTDIVFTDNVSTVPADGPVVVIRNADRVTVTGNVQPMRSGKFADFSGSTAVTYVP